MHFLSHHKPDFVIVGLGILMVSYCARSLPGPRLVRRALWVIAVAILLGGLAMRSTAFTMALPVFVAETLRLGGFMTLLAAVAGSIMITATRALPRVKPEHSPSRRAFVRTVQAAAVAAPAAAVGYGAFIQRSDFRVREVRVPIAGLDPKLDGVTLVQLTDIHLGPFLSEKELARVVDMANETNADIALVTGDLTTTWRDPIAACVRQVGRLQARTARLGCMGNHEIYANTEDFVETESVRRGIEMLRGASRIVEVRGKPLNITGVDYQTFSLPYLEQTPTLVQKGMPNILLSHNPDVFRKAAAQGFDLTISGHTHGGQISVELLHQSMNVARFYTPYVSGLYRENGVAVYVSRGIGTVGIPARLGAPPEISLLRLCAT